jgi:hypothetical protein
MQPHQRHQRTSGLPARVAVAAVVGLLTVLGVLAPPVAAADTEISWAVRTASNDYGAERQNFAYTLDPGGELHDAIVVVNHGERPLDLAVYAADGFTTGSGQLDLVAGDAPSVGVGAWVRAGSDVVTVPPEQSVEVPFTLTVPDSATPGDYLGGIVTSTTQSDEAQGIDVERRLALRIRLRVGGETTPSLSVEDVAVAYSGTANPVGTGDATVDYTVHNTGNTVLTARQAVSVAGPFGTFSTDAGPLAESPALLPGERWKVSTTLSGVSPAVRLTASVALTPLVVDSSGTTSPLDDVVATASTWAVPWALALLVLLIVGLVILTVLLLRRRRHQATDREDARVHDAVAHALREREVTDRRS